MKLLLLGVFATLPFFTFGGTWSYVYTTDWVEKAFTDSGSGADMNLAVWTPVLIDDQVSLGVTAVGTHSDDKPINMQFKGEAGVDYTSPTGFTWKWDDKGTGSDSDYSFWNPICPSGFVPLGAWAHASYDEPSVSVMNCVKDDYAASSNILVDAIWTDGGSGGNNDGSVWEIDNNPNSWFASGYGRPSSDSVYSPPEVVSVEIEIETDLLSSLSSTPDIVSTTIFNNELSTESEVTKELTSEVTDEYSFTQTSGFELSVSATVSFGLPWAGAGGEISTTATTSFEWEESETHSETRSITESITCVAEPNSVMEFEMTVWKGEGEVPFSGTVYFEGGSSAEIGGTWSGVVFGTHYVTCRTQGDEEHVDCTDLDVLKEQCADEMSACLADVCGEESVENEQGEETVDVECCAEFSVVGDLCGWNEGSAECWTANGVNADSVLENDATEAVVDCATECVATVNGAAQMCLSLTVLLLGMIAVLESV